eukprot:TRINITY_DN2040_c2_g3_i1.p1 TRINITY_DN2040_c2_g3~~TRINITY_DN2040_c2_g3_i1.p1  ORF type:complete len:898 (+),score=312.60 TRINITY_DN2040_c2_g3_i1:64-2757(+)
MPAAGPTPAPPPRPHPQEAPAVLSLERARGAVASMRKCEWSDLRHVPEPDQSVADGAEAALIALGHRCPIEWQAARRHLLDPHLKKKITGLSDAVLPQPAWRRLCKLVRRRAACAEEALGGAAADVLMGWVAAAVAEGVLRCKGKPKPVRAAEGAAGAAEEAAAAEAAEAGAEADAAEAEPAAADGCSEGAAADAAPEADAAQKETATGADSVQEPAAGVHPAAGIESAGPDPAAAESPAAVAALRYRVAAMEEALSAKDRELEELRASMSPDRAAPEPQPTPLLTPHAGAEDGARGLSPRRAPRGDAPAESWPAGHGPRAERQPVTAEQTRALALNAWRGFCRAARREMAEHELARVTMPTLHRLLRLYGFEHRPVEAARVELHWAALNGCPAPVYLGDVADAAPPGPPLPAAVNPRNNAGHHRTAAAPRVASPSTPRGAQSPRPSRPARDTPCGNCPESTPRQKKQVAQRAASPLSGAGVVEWPEGKQPPDDSGAALRAVAADPNTVGERWTEQPARRREAPTGRADPNSIHAVRDQFHGRSERDIVRLQEEELKCGIVGGSGATLGGKAARKQADLPAQSDPNTDLTVVADEREGRRRVGALPPPSSCDPNVLSPTAKPSRVEGIQRRGAVPIGSPASGCNPNPVDGATGAVVLTSPVKRGAATFGSPVFSPASKGARGSEAWRVLPALSDPSTAGAGDRAAGKDRKSTGANLSVNAAASCDPNDVRGEEAVMRHFEAQRKDRAEGDRVFAALKQDSFEQRAPADPNTAGHTDKDGQVSRRAAVDAPPAVMRGGAAPNPTGPEAALLGCRRARWQPPPATRTGDAEHPIHGVDAKLHSPCGVGTLGYGVRGTPGRQRAQGFTMLQDIGSEGQTCSPSAAVSRRRHIAQPGNVPL